MGALVLTLQGEPEQRLDLSKVRPKHFASLTEREMAATHVHTTRTRATLGEFFRITAGDPSRIVIEGGSERLDMLGAHLDAGEIVVVGEVGARAGRLMSGGRLEIRGNAGPWAGSGLRGGHLSISGNCGDWLAGPLPGEMSGCTGGYITVGGSAGEMAGDRMFRGIVAIGGATGPYAGSRMKAGTLLVSGRAGACPGYLMRRGTILLGQEPESLSAGFVPSGPADPVFRHLLARHLEARGLVLPWLQRIMFARYGGDMAVIGKGELMVAG